MDARWNAIRNLSTGSTSSERFIAAHSSTLMPPLPPPAQNVRSLTDRSTRTCVTDENDVLGAYTPKLDASRTLDAEVAAYNCAASMPDDCYIALITDRSSRQCVSDEPLIMQVATPTVDCSRSAEFSVALRLQQLSDEARATMSVESAAKRRRDGADSPDRMRQPMDDLACMNRSVAPPSGAALRWGYDAEENEHLLRRTRICLQHAGDSDVLDEPTPVLQPRALGGGAAEGMREVARTSPRSIEQVHLMRRSRICIQHGDDRDVLDEPTPVLQPRAFGGGAAEGLREAALVSPRSIEQEHLTRRSRMCLQHGDDRDVLDEPTPVLQPRALGGGAADRAPATALQHADSPTSVSAVCAQQGLSGGVLVAPTATAGGAGGQTLSTLSADVRQVRSEMSDLSAKLDKLLLLMGDPSQQQCAAVAVPFQQTVG